MRIMIAATFALAIVTVPGSTALAGEAIDRLDRLMKGKFVSTDADNPFTDTRFRIDAPDLGEHVYYYQVNDGPDLEVYRQRVLVVSVGDDGAISQVALSFKDPDKYANAPADAFAGLTMESLLPGLPAGCEQIWSVTDGDFSGYVDPETCMIISSRTGKPRSIEAESILSEKGLLLAERGFDENGEQLFGTEPGEYLTLERK